MVLFLNRTPLHIAIIKKDVDIVKILLNDPNIDVNLKTI